MKTFKKHLEKNLKDPVFKEVYNEEQVLLQLSYELHQKREKAGLSQRDVALQAKLTQQQVSKVENGVNCNILTYLKVGNAVGLHIGIKPMSKTQRSSQKSVAVK